MTSLFAKFRTLTVGNFHEFLDAVIDLNSIAAVKQYARDLEDAKGQIQNEAAKARGNVAAVLCEVSALQLKIRTDEEHMDLILGDDDPSNDHVAEKIQVRVLEHQEELNGKYEEVRLAKLAGDKLLEATRKICTKHAEMVSTIRKLERMQNTTKAKEDATAAIKQAGIASSAANAVSVDNVQQRMTADAAVADEQFNDAVGTVSDVIEDTVAESRAKKLIAERRAKLAAAKNVGPQAEPGAQREG